MIELDEETEENTYDENHHEGHRKRLKNRFLKSIPSSLPDYEILELLLFYVKPRADVKPLAKHLLKEFNGLNRLFSADIHKLISMKGVGESIALMFKLCKELSARLAKEELMNKPIVESWNALIDYVRITMGNSTTEQMRVIYLDKKFMIISDEHQDVGTVDHTPVYPREIIKRAIFLDATSFVLVHNHPSGNTRPSKADIEVTKQIKDLGAALSLKLLDHIIIGSKDYYSFKNSGLI